MKLICEEDEDGKENIYINSFEYIVDEGIEEMEKVFHFTQIGRPNRGKKIVAREVNPDGIVQIFWSKNHRPNDCRDKWDSRQSGSVNIY